MPVKGALIRTFILTVLIVGAGVYLARTPLRDLIAEYSKAAVPSEQPAPTKTPKPGGVLLPVATPVPQPLYGAVNLAVPFQAQAPTGDWGQPWQEACEEASAVLVDAYWRGGGLSVTEAQDRILQLVSWENAHFGYFQQTTSEQAAEMIRAVFGYKKVVVIHNATLADIEANVRASRPVIVPMAGRMLQNPYYTPPGPIYHMLVVKGIASNGDIITDDVGTRHGHNLTYSPAIFMAAMHDLPAGGRDFPPGIDQEAYIESGTPAAIVIYPN